MQVVYYDQGVAVLPISPAIGVTQQDNNPYAFIRCDELSRNRHTSFHTLSYYTASGTRQLHFGCCKPEHVCTDTTLARGHMAHDSGQVRRREQPSALKCCSRVHAPLSTAHLCVTLTRMLLLQAPCDRAHAAHVASCSHIAVRTLIRAFLTDRRGHHMGPGP